MANSMGYPGTVLVTGGTGFLGAHCILQLLQKGYKVRTTLRSIEKAGLVIDALKTGGITSFDDLSFIEASLTHDDNWNEAMKGCDYVLSVASPVFFTLPKDEQEAIRPAVDGILRVLKFARDAGVKRVVMTSNFGAVGFSNKDRKTVTTEADWTNPEEKGLSFYEKSKLLAERAAWNFIRHEGGNLEFATINPVAIFGPPLGTHISGSFALLEPSTGWLISRNTQYSLEYRRRKGCGGFAYPGNDKSRGQGAALHCIGGRQHFPARNSAAIEGKNTKCGEMCLNQGPSQLGHIYSGPIQHAGKRRRLAGEAESQGEHHEGEGHLGLDPKIEQ